jgi:hypothetical protein
MRERAQIAGGWWSIKCPEAGGTIVEFWLPLSTDLEVDDAVGAEGS